jgi:hypothetical protein
VQIRAAWYRKPRQHECRETPGNCCGSWPLWALERSCELAPGLAQHGNLVEQAGIAHQPGQGTAKHRAAVLPLKKWPMFP